MRGCRRDRSARLAVVGVAAVLRAVVVAWAASTFPPAADGTYYHTLATRLAAGHGYSWLWPDGVVTPAAHYPVGYPAFIALGYALFGAKPVVAMVLNAAVGVLGAAAVTDMLLGVTSRTRAVLAGMAFAAHPALLFYTPALMTEGVTTSLLAVAAALAARARKEAPARRRVGALALLGVVLGLTTLVRPQCLALAPLLGLLAATGSVRARAMAAAFTTVVALVVCAPWTARNCVRMEQCALVSVNGGWNLAIGAQSETGAWQALAVPEACREVFAEAAKDACFGREAKKAIAAAPLAWLRRVPAKLRVTFDYFGAAPWYLHEANRERFTWNAKVALGTVETVASRVLLAAALVAAARLAGPRRRARVAIAALGLVGCVLVPGVIAYLALTATLAMLGVRALGRAPVVVGATLGCLVVTVAVHAVFFGAGRYGLVVVPFVTALGFVSSRAMREPGQV